MCELWLFWIDSEKLSSELDTDLYLDYFWLPYNAILDIGFHSNVSLLNNVNAETYDYWTAYAAAKPSVLWFNFVLLSLMTVLNIGDEIILV